jgi:hypothetical protein
MRAAGGGTSRRICVEPRDVEGAGLRPGMGFPATFADPTFDVRGPEVLASGEEIVRRAPEDQGSHRV